MQNIEGGAAAAAFNDKSERLKTGVFEMAQALVRNTICALLLVLATSPIKAFAKHGDHRPPPAKSGWMCYSQGKRSFGGPVGDIWETQTASGADEMEATQNALSRCFSSGLQMCMVQSCWQR
jgi:hypothetical protein